jgi:hypothetical protein
MPKFMFKARGTRAPVQYLIQPRGHRRRRGPTQGILGLPGARPSGTLRVRLVAMTHRT